ncbi:hypothetical protein TraAM80_09092, partial [Trypanosoma rangeli]
EQLRAGDVEKVRSLEELNNLERAMKCRLMDKEEELEELRKAHEDVKVRALNDVNELNDRAEHMNRHLEELREENEQLRASNEQLRAGDVEKVRSLEELNDRAEEMNRQLEELRAENEQLRAQLVIDRSVGLGEIVLTKHRCLLSGLGLGELFVVNAEGLRSAVLQDVARATCVSLKDVNVVEFGANASFCEVEVAHEALVSGEEIARRLRECPFLAVRRLLDLAVVPEDARDRGGATAEVLRVLDDFGVDSLLSLVVEESMSRLVLELTTMSFRFERALEGIRFVCASHQRRELDLLEELDERATEYTDMLEKTEEMMQLLEDARQAECSARNALFKREEALLELERRRDIEVRDLENMTHAHRNLLQTMRQSQGLLATNNMAGLLSEADCVPDLQRQAALLEQENGALRQEMARRAVAHREAMEVLNNKVVTLMEELEVKGVEYTETLAKLEEFVGLLEASRAAEKAALMALERREQELFELQAAHDEEMRELEGAMKQLNVLSPPQQESREEARAAEAPPDTARESGNANVVRSMRQQLERLKREKEALAMELEVKGRQHDDAMDVLNRNIGELMGELDSRIRGCQVSATSAKELLRDIALLRSAEEEDEEYNEGD